MGFDGFYSVHYALSALIRVVGGKYRKSMLFYFSILIPKRRIIAMHLNQEDITLFFKLWFALCFSINCKHKIVPQFEEPIYGDYLEKELFCTIRKELWANPVLIDEFLASDGAMLSDEEKSILMSWRTNFIYGEFIVLKYLKKYAVFMSIDKNPKFYGVCGISDSIELTLQRVLPCIMETALLPFKGKIIYDSIFIDRSVSFGPGMQRTFAEDYKKAKAKGGIIEMI